MAQWGKNDVASNSVIWAPTSVNKAPTRANANTLFGNTTADAYITGETIGMYGVDDAEIAAGSGKVAHTGWVLQTTGSGGRAGRVMTEVLVAGGISNDAEDVSYPDYAIRITTQPLSNTANTTAGGQATFRVVGATTPTGGTLSYQWTYANGGTIATGANVGTTTAANLVVNSAVQTTNASFKVEISTTGGAANVVSSNATLTITT